MTKQLFDYTNLFLTRTAGQRVRPPLVCKDGYTLSVQASDTHYSSPKDMTADVYHLVEVATDYPCPSLGKRDTSGGIYPFVPVAKVNALVRRHGGLSNA